MTHPSPQTSAQYLSVMAKRARDNDAGPVISALLWIVIGLSAAFLISVGLAVWLMAAAV